MKHSRVKAVSFAAGLAASLAGPLPARSADLIFIEHGISTAARSAESVFATDVDGDGNTDVLSASFNDDKIAWYENLGLCGFDADGDGDVDLLDFGAFQRAFTGPR